MEQQTDEWLDWRKKGIGSSDAPIIMGVSPWKTPYQLWLEKTGRFVPEQTSNWAQERGNELEPIARARYELECDIEMGPALCQHWEFSWARASMDGWNPLHKRGLEIKFVGSNDFQLAKSGVVPVKYFPQLQHQFMVTGAEQIDFYGYYVPKGAENHRGESVTIQTRPDPKYIQNLFEKEYSFWMRMVSDVPPPFIQGDYKLIRVKGAKALADEYVRVANFAATFTEGWPNVTAHDDHKKLLEQGRQALLEMAGEGPRFRIGKLLINNGIITISEEESDATE